MKENKPVLIVENCTSGLRLNESASVMIKGVKQYVLSGVFTEFDILNRNERIYTADKFIPHLNELLQRKAELTAIYGEFDHPDVFDTSLTRISHTIEKAIYNQPKNRVDGEIRLLNTTYGKEAKALVDDNCPLFVSSRAAGVTESNGTVTVKKLFTYDLVADPGFGSARMEQHSLNESLGFNNKKNLNFRIYELSDESKINELFTMNQNDYVTKNQMVEYSNYLKQEILKLKTELNESVTNGVEDPAQITKMSELYENMQEQYTKLTGYLDYLAERVQIVVNENIELKEKTEKLIEHNDYLAVNLEKNIKYSEYLAEELDKNIDYGEYIAETLDKNIDFAEYIAENLNKNIEFSDYLAENLDKNIEYGEYLAENLDKNIAYGEYLAENLDNSISYGEYIAENLDKDIAYGEYLAENLDKDIDYVKYIAENLDNNIAYSEYLAEHADNTIAYGEYIAEHLDNSIAYSEYISENLEDTQAYNNYLAEGLDRTVEALKGRKLFEEFGNEIPNMRADDVEQYYDKDEDEENDEENTPGMRAPIDGVQGQVQPNAQDNAQGQVQPIQGRQAQGQPTPSAQAQGMPNQVQGRPVQVQGQPNFTGQQAPTQPGMPGMPTSVEGSPVPEVEMVPGATVAVENQTGEILMYNPQSKMVLIQLASDGSQQQFHESKVTVIGDKLLKSEDDLKSYISGLITETKKRKAAETQEPHYLTFLTEKNKNIWRNLSAEDKEKINYAINESGNQIYSEKDVLLKIQDALTVNKKSFDEVLLENIPSDLKGLWENVNETYKKSILSQARLYPDLSTPMKIESFWNTRGLENYVSLNESKKTLNESQIIDGSRLSDEQIEKFINKLKNIG